MSADQGSSKVLTLTKSESAPAELHDVPALVVEVEAEAAPAVQALPAAPPATGPIDTRTLSRSLFLRLAALDENSPERAYVRDTLIELNLPSSGTRRPASAPGTSRWRTSSRSAPSA